MTDPHKPDQADTQAKQPTAKSAARQSASQSKVASTTASAAKVKTVAKTSVKSAGKKSVASGTAKSASKPTAKSKAPAQAQAKAKAPVKGEKSKTKLVRDNVTMPREDWDLLQSLKTRALSFSRPTKKSELLRAGLKLLAGLSDAKLQAALESLTPLKAESNKGSGK